MTIRRKLQVLCWVTGLGLLLLLVFTIYGFESMKEAETTAKRRASYSMKLVEIKASAISTIMLDPTLKETRDVFAEAEKNIAKFGEQVAGTIKRPDVRDEFKQILSHWERYDRDSQALIKLAATDAKAANAQLVPLYNEQFRPFQASLEDFVSKRVAEAEASSATANHTADRVYWTNIPILIVIAAVNIILVVLLSATLQKSLAGILDKLALLRHGNLTERLPVSGNDELSQIAASVNEFAQEMEGIVGGVRTGADELNQAAAQLATAARQVASGSAQQSESAASTASAIEEMSVSVSSIADTAAEVRQLSNASREDALQGSQSIAQLQDELAKVRTGVHDVATHVREFIDSTNAIAGMTQQIREIADQTNLLALNAAIEAARAGEQGRGFAVVADEVRKLAERAAHSAGEITQVTADLNSKSSQLDRSVEAGVNSLAASETFVDKLSTVLQRASQSVQQTTTGVDDVTASVHEQKAASAEIARNVEQIAQMAESNRAANHNGLQAATRLEELAAALKAKVDRFRIARAVG